MTNPRLDIGVRMLGETSAQETSLQNSPSNPQAYNIYLQELACIIIESNKKC